MTSSVKILIEVAAESRTETCAMTAKSRMTTKAEITAESRAKWSID